VLLASPLGGKILRAALVLGCGLLFLLLTALLAGEKLAWKAGGAFTAVFTFAGEEIT